MALSMAIVENGDAHEDHPASQEHLIRQRRMPRPAPGRRRHDRRPRAGGRCCHVRPDAERAAWRAGRLRHRPGRNPPRGRRAAPPRVQVTAMGTRITDLEDPRFDALFTQFRHTAYRLESLQVYDVGYEIGPFRAFLAGQSRPRDESKNAWTEMLRNSRRDGKIVQRVHLVGETLTDYLRYE